MNEKMFIEFSLDYDGVCEGIDTFEVNGENKLDDVFERDVDNFVEELLKLDEFFVSEHRTEVWISWYPKGTMKVGFRYFNEPEDGEFDDYQFETKSIDFKYGEE